MTARAMNFPASRFQPYISRVLGIAAVLIGLIFVPTAVAASVPDPAVDMYAEHIPDEEGDKPSKETEFGDEPNDLPPGTKGKLKGQGTDGERVLQLVAVGSSGDSGSGTNGANGNRTDNKSGADGNSQGGSGSDASAEPTLEAAGSGFVGDGGLGLLFPLVLIVSVVGAVMLGWLRHQSLERK